MEHARPEERRELQQRPLWIVVLHGSSVLLVSLAQCNATVHPKPCDVKPSEACLWLAAAPRDAEAMAVRALQGGLGPKACSTLTTLEGSFQQIARVGPKRDGASTTTIWVACPVVGFVMGLTMRIRGLSG